MDRIAGFERYLSITEEDRLETLHPPEKTPELFERYLPHAIALGVENRWAGKFAARARRRLGRSQPAGRHDGWYSGSQNAWSNPGMFATAVGAHAGEQRRLGLDRAGIEQRLGRRRLLRRRRRRRRRRRLVG